MPVLVQLTLLMFQKLLLWQEAEKGANESVCSCNISLKKIYRNIS